LAAYRKPTVLLKTTVGGQSLEKQGLEVNPTVPTVLFFKVVSSSSIGPRGYGWALRRGNGDRAVFTVGTVGAGKCLYSLE